MRRLSLLVLIILFGAGAGTCAAAVPPLVADLSSHHINITTSFTGTRLLLFGATEGAGDIIVVVRGPKRREVVRRKERIAGIWVNREEVAFADVPGYYFQASTRPPRQVTSEATLKRLQIGFTRLPMPAQDAASAGEASEYRQALLRLKERSRLYSVSPAPIKVIGERLFRVELMFPASVSTGTYMAEIHLFRNGKRVSVDRKELLVRRAGAEEAIFNFAHRHSAIYGIIAVLIALAAGWLAGVIFRKV